MFESDGPPEMEAVHIVSPLYRREEYCAEAERLARARLQVDFLRPMMGQGCVQQVGKVCLRLDLF